MPLTLLFQSTPPVWGETADPAEVTGFNTISIHSPRVGGDSKKTKMKVILKYFNPLPPCGGRQDSRLNQCPLCKISIHSPRVGGDWSINVRSFISNEFQSTPPVWGETGLVFICKSKTIFQSTPPVWGETHYAWSLHSLFLFQSTPPVWGETANIHKFSYTHFRTITQICKTLATLLSGQAFGNRFFRRKTVRRGTDRHVCFRFALQHQHFIR